MYTLQEALLLPNFYTLISLGWVNDITRISVFSHCNTTIKGFQPLNHFSKYSWQEEDVFLELFSSSDQDHPNGKGAREVSITGYNETKRKWLNETIKLNGTNPVILNSRFIRTNSAVVMRSGKYGRNIGDIYLRVEGTGEIAQFIPAMSGDSRMGVYTVPHDCLLLINQMTFSSTAPVSVGLDFQTKSGPGMRGAPTVCDTSTLDLQFQIPLPIPPGTDCMMWCESKNGGESVSGAFLGIEVPLEVLKIKK